MASTVFPAASAGGGIKSVQRGLAGSSGNVTITAVDISKSFVNIYGTASSGTVASSGSISTSGNIASNLDFKGSGDHQTNFFRFPSGGTPQVGSSSTYTDYSPQRTSYNQTLTGAGTSNQSGNLSGGSNNLVAAVVQGYLSDSTTLVVSGACRWEVVEFN